MQCGNEMMSIWQLLLIGLTAGMMMIAYTDGLAVMSVDLGSEFMKVALVKPGVPMDIVINSESRRKTNVVVGMRQGERTFGDAAMSTAVKYPDKAYWYLQDLIGKTSDNPMVKLYQKRFPYYTMTFDPDTNMPVFQHDEDTVYHPEELLAMVLEQARESATTFAEQPVTEAVITVPVFFNQAERRALLRAAEMIDLKVIQLMNSETAVALNYGVFRRKNFNATEAHYMFFNMGASSTTATVVGYQLAKNKNSVTGTSETHPQLTIKGIGYDRTLGGSEFSLRLRDYLAKSFDEKKKTSSDLYSNKRAMGKLYKESNRLKHVLSANVEHMSQIEGLLDDEDFRMNVKRETFEGMCEDLYARIAAPIEEAMKMSEVTWEEISEVILMGGSTRMPKVKQELQKIIKREELGQGINTDEAAALGAVYQAAYLSKGFRVKKFVIKEATVYPIQPTFPPRWSPVRRDFQRVEFEKVRTESDDTLPKRIVKRTLFGRGNPYPQKKVMTFNKHVKDFSFEVNYGEMEFLGEDRMSAFGETKLQKISLTGVEPIYVKYSEEAEPKGIKAHFRMDESGLLTLEKSEAIYEKENAVEEGADKKESTLEKLGSYFFGSEEKEDTEGGVDGKTEPGAESGAVPGTEGGDSDGGGDKDTQTEKVEETGDKSEKNDKENNVENEGEQAEKNDGNDEEKEVKEEKDEMEEEVQSDSEPEAPETTSDEKKTDDKEEKTEEKSDEEQAEEKIGDDKKGDEGSEEKKVEDEEKKKPKKVTIKELVDSDMIHVDGLDPSKESIQLSKSKITDLRKKDQEKRELEAARNDLETYIFDVQDKLYQEMYEACSKEEERESLRSELADASDWLYDQDDEGKKVFIDKLKTLRKSSEELFYRVEQYKERPRALEALNSAVNYSEHFIVTMANFTGEDQPFTEVEYGKLKDMINETKEWNSTFVVDLLAQPLTERPKTTIEDIAHKISDIDREVKYLIGKAKRFTPKVPKTSDLPKTNDTKDEQVRIDPDLGDLPEGVKVVKLNPDGSTSDGEGININGKTLKFGPDGKWTSDDESATKQEDKKEETIEEEPEILELGDGNEESTDKKDEL